jgi:hypothetical protein
MRDWSSREFTEVAKSDTALLAQGRYLSLEGGRDMLRLNMRLNLAIHLPLRWIAALLYLFR